MIRHFPGPTWESSHVYGEGQKNDLRKLCYWQIPKCASMWMRSYLVQLGQDRYEDIWTAANFTVDDMAGCQSIILLRDPVERWISACPGADKIVELAKRYGDDVDAICNNLAISTTDHIFLPWQKDEHTTPQVDFIAGVDLDNAVFFRCDRRLSSNVEHFLRSRGFFDHKVSAPAPINENPSNHNPLLKQAADAWRLILQTPRYLEKYKIAYERDYELIDSVEFYDGQ